MPDYNQTQIFLLIDLKTKKSMKTKNRKSLKLTVKVTTRDVRLNKINLSLQCNVNLFITIYIHTRDIHHPFSPLFAFDSWTWNTK